MDVNRPDLSSYVELRVELECSVTVYSAVRVGRKDSKSKLALKNVGAKCEPRAVTLFLTLWVTVR